MGRGAPIVVLLAIMVWLITAAPAARADPPPPQCSPHCPATVLFQETGLNATPEWCVEIITVNAFCTYPTTGMQPFPVITNTNYNWFSWLGYYSGTYPTGYVVHHSPPWLYNATSSYGSLDVGGDTEVTINYVLPHVIQHVVVIFMENANLSSVQQYGHYENYLASTYEAASSYYAACHQSSPNYRALIAAASGSCTLNSQGDVYHEFYNATIGDVLDNSFNITPQDGFIQTWANYAENLPSDACTKPQKYTGNGTGSKGGPGTFATKHVPFLSEYSTAGHPAYCNAHVTSVYSNGNGTGLNFIESVKQNKMANVSFISPNLCDDGHSNCNGEIGQNASCVSGCPTNGGAAIQIGNQADVWLNGFMSSMINATGYFQYGNGRLHDLAEMQHTVFFVLYDEAEGSGANAGYSINNNPEPANNNSHYCSTQPGIPHTNAVCGGKVYEVTVIPNGTLFNASMRGYQFTQDDSSYGVLASIEHLFGLSGGVCHDQRLQGLGNLTNPACLDHLWLDDPGASNNYEPMLSEFKFGGNGYY